MRTIAMQLGGLAVSHWESGGSLFRTNCVKILLAVLTKTTQNWIVKERFDYFQRGNTASAFRIASVHNLL